jgi:hypothetical protein
MSVLLAMQTRGAGIGGPIAWALPQASVAKRPCAFPLHGRSASHLRSCSSFVLSTFSDSPTLAKLSRAHDKAITSLHDRGQPNIVLEGSVI